MSFIPAEDDDDDEGYRYRSPRSQDFSDIKNVQARRILMEELEEVKRSDSGPHEDNVHAVFNCRCPCPNHPDKHPSSFVIIFTDGGWTIGCHAGCRRIDILESLSLKASDLAPPRARKFKEPDVVYDYYDAHGTLAYQVCRYNEASGKRFCIRRPDGPRRWKYSIKGTPIIPYRLRELIRAIDRGEPVYITEGEKDADRLFSLGLTATTNPMGSSKWPRSFAPCFKGAQEVNILADNDPPGEHHAQQVACNLKDHAASIRIVRFPDAGPKGDVSDWLDQGHTCEDLQQHIQETPLWDGDQRVPDPPPASQGSDYGQDDSGIFLKKRIGDDGEVVKKPLANFQARIILDRSEHDGTEICRTFDIEVVTPRGQSTVSVPASDFAAMNWIREKVGASAVILPGPRYYEHVACAIQFTSAPVPEETVYAHTGWEKVNGEMVYLHSGGAITRDGLVTGIKVNLSPSLSPFQLPAPPSDNEAKSAVRASLELLSLAPWTVTVPLFGVVWRAPLGLADFSIHVTGASGVFKSALVALAIQHYGAGFDARHLPAAWSATSNALEALAYQMKDAPIVVDDFCPHGSSYDRHKLQGAADRLLRAQGNASARIRMRADTTLRSPKPPRGIIISTGEDGFEGKSLNARVMTNELAKGDVDVQHLTKMQAYAREAIFATACSGYIQWLAEQDDTLAATCQQERQALRTQFASHHAHARTPEMLADIALGWRLLLQYAVDCMAISAQERQTYETKIVEALLSVNETQATYQTEHDPARRFLELVMAAITSQQAHVADASGQASMTAPTMWGWKERRLGGEDGGIDWQGGGTRIGYIDEQDELLYLDEDAALLAARAMARGSGDELVLTKAALRKRLGEGGYLLGEERGGKSYWAARVLLMGQRRIVLRIPWSKLGYTRLDSHNGDIPSGWTI